MAKVPSIGKSFKPDRDLFNRPIRRQVRHLEDELQRAVFEHIRLRGISGLVAWHTPNGGLRSKVYAARLKSLGVLAGVADIILVHAGKTYALELKVPGGRVSEAQIEWQHAVADQGVEVANVTGLDNALNVLERWGLLQ